MTAKSPLPPGKFGLPVVGETLAFFTNPQFSRDRHKEYGPIFKSRILNQPTVFFKGPDANKFLFAQENRTMVAKWPKSTATLLGPASLAVKTGHGHRIRRRLMVQAFRPRALENYAVGMDEIARDYCDRWLQLGEFAWYSELRDYTLDVACKLLVGLDQGSKTRLGTLYETWVGGLFSLPIRLPWTVFGKALKAREELIQEITGIIGDRQSQAVNPKEDAQDALGMLLQAEDEEGNRLSLDDLCDQVLVLLFAGHETLTSALASFCLLVAQHPEVWEKLRTEQEAVGWNLARSPRQDELNAMTYLEWTLQEVLRLVPPVGGGFREAIADFEYGGYRIPKGWSVLYQINRTHDDPELYDDPNCFNPDRWNPEGEKSNPGFGGYIPFGGGVRECLGKEFARLELRILAARLIQLYNWELLPDQDLSFVIVPTPRPRDNLKVRFTKRQKKSMR
ncbi:MAG: cytochrome P450 [Cyanobacteria bacterium P01_C01_bin.89]